MNKIVKIALVVIGVIAAIMWYQLPGREVPNAEAVQSTPLNIMFILMYLLLAIAVFFSLIFTLKNLFSNPRSLKRTLIFVGAFLLLVAVAYALASGTDVSIDEMAARGIDTSESTIRRIGTGLNVFFFLVIIALGAMAWGGIKRMSKR